MLTATTQDGKSAAGETETSVDDSIKLTVSSRNWEVGKMTLQTQQPLEANPSAVPTEEHRRRVTGANERSQSINLAGTFILEFDIPSYRISPSQKRSQAEGLNRQN